MVTIIVIFIIAIIAFVPICFTSIGASTWSNSMAWRIMDDIDPYQSSDARMIKQEISDWLDLKPREKKYDEEYSRGCDSTWRQLFNSVNGIFRKMFNRLKILENLRIGVQLTTAIRHLVYLTVTNTSRCSRKCMQKNMG